MCGEKKTPPERSIPEEGSPPRVRGKVLGTGKHVATIGITPACAGKSFSFFIRISQYRDHPRVCGEKSDSLLMKGMRMGSPPRVRGKVFGLQLDDLEFGITPACAGKSVFHFHFLLLFWDHPRVCGEKTYQRLKSSGWKGSPPRVRGKD